MYREINLAVRCLQERIFDVLDQLARDPFLPILKTHKLSGQLQGLWACWVEYDCRIIFAFPKGLSVETEPQTGEESIVLIDLGTHAEVYPVVGEPKPRLTARGAKVGPRAMVLPSALCPRSSVFLGVRG